MPIFEPIRMPKHGIDAFYEGMANSQKMFDSFANRRIAQGRLEVAQKQEQRHQTILPHLLQQYADKHNLSPLERQKMAAEVEKYQQENSFNKWLDQKMMGQNQNEQAPSQAPEEQKNASPLPQENNGMESPRAPNPNANSMGRHETVAIANQDQAAMDAARQSNPMNPAPGAPPIANSPVQPAQASVPMPQIPTPQDQNGAPESNYVGKEMVLKPPRKGMEFLDELAGMTAHGRTFKGPERGPVTDGMQQIRYPSGKVTIQKVGPNTEEKAAIQVDTAHQKAQAAHEVKAAGDIEKEMPGIITSIKNMADIGSIINKNPSITGFYRAIPGGQKLSQSEEFGSLVAKTNAARGDIATAVTGRNTGAKSLMLASMQKPDVEYSKKRNMGMVEANLEIAKSKFDEYKNTWERAHPNKEFPYKFPKEAEEILRNTKIRENSRLKKLADEAIALNPKRKAEILAELKKLTLANGD